MDLPIVPLDRPEPTVVVEALSRHGFLLVDRGGHGDEELTTLDQAAQRYFAQPEDVRARDAMARNGRTWRGWFGVGGELTSGRPDGKEGFYFGTDLPADDPRVLAGLPLHGPNPTPTGVPELGDAVRRWMALATDVGHRLLAAVAEGLELPADWFRTGWCADPVVLFRIFRYPPADQVDDGIGVQQHTDYGLLTVLAHDGTPGLQVFVDDQWIDVPADPALLVVNIGDMLERATSGFLRSTLHRVRSQSTARLSFPLFLDPGWDVRVENLPIDPARFGPSAGRGHRWDDIDPLSDGLFSGEWTYGEYLTNKVSRVFPDLLDGTG